MRITRIVAVAIIAASAGVTALDAQTLRSAGPPAEYPPSSYKGKQYVDSRGCIYIRAGIDGAVNWVPRVTRSRKQLCGYKPTTVAGSTAQPGSAGAGVELITLPASQQPSATAAAAKPAAKPATKTPPQRTSSPRVVTTTKPRRTPQTTSAQPPRRVVKPQPVPQPVPVPSAKPRVVAPPPQTVQSAPVANARGGCSGASALSQKYINQSGVRCGPQAESPVTYGTGQGIGPQSSVILTPNTRVVPVHVYQKRRLSDDLTVPAGYRSVWQDDRLNRQRAERTLRPAVLTSATEVPRGFARVERETERLNPMRGVRTPQGDAQMAQIWSEELPRTLRTLPLDRQTVTVSQAAARSQAEAADPLVLNLSTRSAPEAGVQPTRQTTTRRPSYVRAATFQNETEARAAAQALAAQGLPVRLGSVSRGGKSYKVVLAGPFGNPGTAQQAMKRVRDAGFSGARLSR